MGFEVVQGLGTLLSFEFRVPGFEFRDKRNSSSYACEGGRTLFQMQGKGKGFLEVSSKQ